MDNEEIKEHLTNALSGTRWDWSFEAKVYHFDLDTTEDTWYIFDTKHRISGGFILATAYFQTGTGSYFGTSAFDVKKSIDLLAGRLKEIAKMREALEGT